MSDEKQRWKAAFNSITGNVLWDLIKTTVAAVLLAIGGTRLLNQSVSKTPWITIAILGAYVLTSQFVQRTRQSSKGGRTQEIAIGLLKADCVHLLQRYKELDFDNRDQARLPRHNSSWPGFGEPWSYVHVSLYSCAMMLNLLIFKARVLWIATDRKDEPLLFALTDSAKMFQVIDALDDFNRRLEALQHASA